MTESTSNSLNHGANNTSVVPQIPIEIVSDEEMAFIEAAFSIAATRSSSIPSPSRSVLFQNNARSIRSISFLSKRRFSGGSNPNFEPEIEDLGDLRCTQKKIIAPESFYLRHRKRNGLFVTDITSTEWCPKQMEFYLKRRERKISTKAMKAGTGRHKELENEVLKRVKVNVESVEDKWAIKFINFITGVNRLLSEGLTRELPVIGFVQGIWVTGVIDEIRMPDGENSNPILVDTKTRGSDTLPSEPQKRNGRLQLMCYKLLWDNLGAGNFPSEDFFDFFSLNPNNRLSKEIRTSTAAAGVPAQTLDDIVRYLGNTCSTLIPADRIMILRYESQKDDSLLGEVEFEYEPDWLKAQMDSCLELWVDGVEASFTPEDERWKCRSCQFSVDCPANTKISSTSSSVENTTDKVISSESSPVQNSIVDN